jgi:Iap family predicted aminopeptidase
MYRVRASGHSCSSRHLAGSGRADAMAALDLEGKVAVVQMSPPQRELPRDISVRPFRYAMANVVERVAGIAAKKPAAIVFVADAVADSGWEFVVGLKGTYGLDFNEGLLGLPTAVPVLWVHQRAMALLAQPGQRLKATLIAERITYPSVNVVARVRGTDPALRDEYVLFSAHQDHDGIKAPVAGDSIWNGADDNASVSVGILAIGRAWARQPARRSALFVWHGAEEKGLLGSRYHAANPAVPIKSITAVLNADMIGANSPDSAALLGVQPPHLNSRVLADMGLRANDLVSKFALDTLWDRPNHPENWYFRSDHVPYARLGIPSLYFSSLPHPLYHTPLDDPEHINYAKVTRVTRWMSAAGWMAANAAERVTSTTTAR